MTYVKSYIREVNGKRIHVNGYERRQNEKERRFGRPESQMTDAELALDEVNEYEGDNLWQDVVMGYDIDNERHNREDPEGSYHIFFKDGSSLYLNGGEWDVDDE